MKQVYKFEGLEVWEISLDFLDIVYEIGDMLPTEEKFNLISQFRRSATSVSLNIAEGSTNASDAEQARYLDIAIRSYIESFACYKIMIRRKYVDQEIEVCKKFELTDVKLFAKIQALIKSLRK